MAAVPPRRGEPGNGQEDRLERVRGAALEAVAARPGIDQGELAQRLRDKTGIPISAAITSIRGLEREGTLAIQRDGRDEGYVVAAPPLEGVTDEPEESVDAALLRGDEEAMGAFREERGPAVQAYCARVCEVDAIPAAEEASFRSFAESVAHELSPEADLDAALLRATREQAAERATISPTSAAGRSRIARLAGASRPTAACEVMPMLLVAGRSDLLSAAETEKISLHISGCSRCQATHARFEEAEIAFADRLAQRPLGEVGDSEKEEAFSDELPLDQAPPQELVSPDEPAGQQPPADGSAETGEEEAAEGEPLSQPGAGYAAEDPPVPGMGWWIDSSVETSQPAQPWSRDDASQAESWPALGGEQRVPAVSEPAGEQASGPEVGLDSERAGDTLDDESPAANGGEELDEPPPRRRRLPEMTRRAWVIALVLALLALLAGVAVAVVAGTSDDAPPAPQAAAPPSTPVASPPAAAEPSSSTLAPERRSSSGKSRAAVDPSSVSVAVLSGTGAPGIAGRTGQRLEDRSYKVGAVANAAEPVESSEILHRPGGAREARSVGRELDVSRLGTLDPANRALAGDADVVVVVGPDLVSESRP